MFSADIWATVVAKWNWIVSKLAVLSPYKAKLSSVWADYGIFVLVGFAVILIVVAIDQLYTRGYLTKLYDYFFKEPE